MEKMKGATWIVVAVAGSLAFGVYVTGQGSSPAPLVGSPSPGWYVRVAEGEVPGYQVVHKFGSGLVGSSLGPITTSGEYRMPTAATSLELLSDSANDTDGGTGARQVTVIGLDSSWNEVSQTVTTTGTSATPIPTDLTRLLPK